MIVNAYAVLDAFVSLLRLGLGLLVVWLGFLAWRAWARLDASSEERNSLEDRCYLLFLLAGLLLALNVLAWPLSYLLLQSYIPEWPGIMCIYGVTQIGSGSIGSSRFLPPLVLALQIAKPLLVLLSGAWFVLYLLGRRSRTGSLTGRVLALLLVAGLLGVADALAEVAYLAIPKKEEFLSVGCCTALDGGSRDFRFLPAAWFSEGRRPLLLAAYCGVNLAMIAVLACLSRRQREGRPRPFGLAFLLAAALVSVAGNMVFLIEFAAPRLIGLPDHHCPYDLVGRAPESLVAMALFLAGAFCVCWACVAGWLGAHPDTGPFLPALLARLFRLGEVAYLWSLLMMTVELLLT